MEISFLRNAMNDIARIKGIPEKEVFARIDGDGVTHIYKTSIFGGDGIFHFKTDEEFNVYFDEIILSEQYGMARDLAEVSHNGQVDKQGNPYFGHLKRVSDKCYNMPSRIVALLHDIIEDTSVDEQMLRAGFRTDIVDAVVALTKLKSETYGDYIHRLSTNPMAVYVKIRDLEDNMNVARLPELRQADIDRLEKYHKAYTFLKSLPC